MSAIAIVYVTRSQSTRYSKRCSLVPGSEMHCNKVAFTFVTDRAPRRLCIANKTLICSTFQTPLGDTLFPSAKQPLEPYQMELGPRLPTSQEAPFIPYFYCGGTHQLTLHSNHQGSHRCQALIDNPLP